MIEQKPALVVIGGPTAAGKTELALQLATRISMEIVSADSRQVYRNMDIGTAKPSLAEQQQVPHHLIDIIEPDEEFSVAAFVEQARDCIAAIRQRGRLPCVVGGTGLYIKALLGGLAPLPGADPALRRQLHEEERGQGSGTLHHRLAQVDPQAAGRIHPHNLVRIVRALEVYQLSGRPLTAWQAEHRFAEQPYRALQLVPEWQRSELYRRIDERTARMLEAGLVAEVERLLDIYPPQLKAFRTLGYQQVLAYLQGQTDRAGMLEEIRIATRRYAKRQLTWVRRQEGIIWVDSSTNFGNVLQSIENFILQ